MNQSELLLMLIPALVALAGGVLAMYWHPGHQTRSLIQHFAAGVVLAALAVELLPEIGREHAPGYVLIGAFALGSLFMYAMKLWTTHLEEAGEPTKSGLDWGLLVATFIDIAVDGFIIGAGFAAGGETGPILALGLSVELLFLGLALTSEATRGWRIVVIAGLLGVTVLVCAVLGVFLLSGASNTVIAAALAFSAAALLYLVTEELLIEAHAVEEKPVATLVLFGGFLVFWSIQLLGV
ncbi:zinc permease [Candidatus Thiothrix sp. Deng01]|uniref:Zinc permease n=1 Tax=Candidatus Thiothrix phosphatis TaxID=3112415 RepID=A0ABU6D017_9GAMM|nr:zinc permease [Candidatus Thiothrix sp. Deng01]MEB4591679.1 zinc permease [Candidatus Thiothrix sp. Deng01]